MKYILLTMLMFFCSASPVFAGRYEELGLKGPVRTLNIQTEPATPFGNLEEVFSFDVNQRLTNYSRNSGHAGAAGGENWTIDAGERRLSGETWYSGGAYWRHSFNYVYDDKNSTAQLFRNTGTDEQGRATARTEQRGKLDQNGRPVLWEAEKGIEVMPIDERGAKRVEYERNQAGQIITIRTWGVNPDSKTSTGGLSSPLQPTDDPRDFEVRLTTGLFLLHKTENTYDAEGRLTVAMTITHQNGNPVNYLKIINEYDDSGRMTSQAQSVGNYKKSQPNVYNSKFTFVYAAPDLYGNWQQAERYKDGQKNGFVRRAITYYE